MRVDCSLLGARGELMDKGYRLPGYDVDSVRRQTAVRPQWVHFGAGNIFRAYQSRLCEELLNSGALTTGIVVAEGYDYEIIDRIYATHDNLSLVATLCADGTVTKSVVASVTQAYKLDPAEERHWLALTTVFTAESLQLASFTITEKGYSLVNSAGDYYADVSQDMVTGPATPVSYMGKVTALIYCRYLAGALPIALVSMDNCSHNGDKLFSAVTTIAQAWVDNGLCDDGFITYLTDGSRVSFPWTMIDKITPRPDEHIATLFESDGIDDIRPIITSKHTYIAPFVNAEQAEYLVIEDHFPNGRPPLEQVGVYFTTRATVDQVERMKVCTCLNPLHTCLAIFGCLLGYTRICEEMQDADLVQLITRLGYVEGLPVVTHPGIISPKSFIDEVVTQRIPNPFLPDTPQRIACDTSQKLPIRFGETIKAYDKSESLAVDTLRVVPLLLAGWLRYLMAIDDQGAVMPLSPDPLLPEVTAYVSDITLGENSEEAIESAVSPLLHRADIFGVDLYAVGLAKTVVTYLTRMTQCTGAVRETIHNI